MLFLAENLGGVNNQLGLIGLTSNDGEELLVFLENVNQPREGFTNFIRKKLFPERKGNKSISVDFSFTNYFQWLDCYTSAKAQFGGDYYVVNLSRFSCGLLGIKERYYGPLDALFLENPEPIEREDSHNYPINGVNNEEKGEGAAPPSVLITPDVLSEVDSSIDSGGSGGRSAYFSAIASYSSFEALILSGVFHGDLLQNYKYIEKLYYLLRINKKN